MEKILLLCLVASSLYHVTVTKNISKVKVNEATQLPYKSRESCDWTGYNYKVRPNYCCSTICDLSCVGSEKTCKINAIECVCEWWEEMPTPYPTPYPTRAVPETWECTNSFYNAGDGCDCNCGAYDPDCDSSALVFNCDSDEVCTSSGKCQSPPAEWICSSSWFGTRDGCDCNCGAFDPDCDFEAQPVSNCEEGQICIFPGECSSAYPSKSPTFSPTISPATPYPSPSPTFSPTDSPATPYPSQVPTSYIVSGTLPTVDCSKSSSLLILFIRIFLYIVYG